MLYYILFVLISFLIIVIIERKENNYVQYWSKIEWFFAILFSLLPCICFCIFFIMYLLPLYKERHFK